MSILDYFRTKKAIAAGLDRLRTDLWEGREELKLQRAESGKLLNEAREECIALADRCDRLTERLAQAVRDRDAAWRALAAEQSRPAPAPLPSTDAGLRAELRKEQDRAADLEAQLDKVQRANMAADIPV